MKNDKIKLLDNGLDNTMFKEIYNSFLFYRLELCNGMIK